MYKGDPTIGGQVIPLGLAYIGAMCERKGYEVKIFDFSATDNIEQTNGFTYYGLPKEKIMAQLKEYNPDLVGIQCMYSAYSQDAYDIARISKELGKEVMMGGAHVSACPNEVNNNPDVDWVILGEGEKYFEPIDNLDALPYPAWHLLPIERYINKHGQDTFNMRPSMFVITSRGCPYNCKFCSVRLTWGRTWRGHSAKRVLNEIEYLIKKYKVGEIHFVDDNFALDTKRLEEICDGLKKLNVKWTTPNGIAIWKLTLPLLLKMKQSGCYRLTFGLETACLKTSEYIRKKIDLNHATKIIKYANKLGIWTISTFIIGFPDETKEDIEETINFALKSDLDFAFFFLPMPFPNTDMAKDYIERGLIKEINGEMLSGRRGVGTKHFTAEQLREIQQDAYNRMVKRTIIKFLNPLRIISKIHSWEDLRYCLRLIKVGIKQIKARYES